MRPEEFYKIMEEFVIEDKRWRALKRGDTVYEPDELKNEKLSYKPLIVNDIYVDKRVIVVRDYTNKIPGTKWISYFLTQEEYGKL